MVGILYEVDEIETESFEQFKKAVGDLKQEDQVLIRFLRARNYDIGNAESMIRNAIQWRKDMDIENFIKWDFPKYYNDDIGYSFHGKDREGAPILWIPVGKWNGKNLVENGEGENLLRWGFVMMERGLKASSETNSQGQVVVDLEGLSYSQVSHVASLKLFYQGCQRVEQCYPELIKSVTIINAPWVFTIGFNFIKGIITRKTMAKLQIFGSNRDQWLGELLGKFPSESIIPELVKDVNGN